MIVWLGLAMNGMLFAGAWWIAGTARALGQDGSRACWPAWWSPRRGSSLGSSSSGPRDGFRSVPSYSGRACCSSRDGLPEPSDRRSGDRPWSMAPGALADRERDLDRPGALGHCLPGDAVAPLAGEGGQRRADLSPLLRGRGGGRRGGSSWWPPRSARAPRRISRPTATSGSPG